MSRAHPPWAALPHLLGEALICASTTWQLSSYPGRGPFEVRFCFIFNYLCLRNGFQISLVLEVTWLHPNCLLNPLQYSCPENPMDRGAWQAVVHRVTKSQRGLKWLNNTAFSSQGKNSFYSGLMLVSPHWSDPKGKKLSHSHTHTHTPLCVNSFQESCGHLRSFPYFRCCLEFSWKGSRSAKLTSPGPVTYKYLFLLIVLSLPPTCGEALRTDCPVREGRGRSSCREPYEKRREGFPEVKFNYM